MLLRFFGWLGNIDELIGDYIHPDDTVLATLRNFLGSDYEGVVRKIHEKNTWVTKEVIGEALGRLSRQGSLHMRMGGNPFGEGEKRTLYTMRYYVRK